MNNNHLWHACLALLLCYGIFSSAFAEQPKSAGVAGDTLVVVKQIVATDISGRDHLLYQEQSGRIYRWDNIEQAVLDLSSKGIKEKGVYRNLRAVLDNTVYVMDGNQSPRPEQIRNNGMRRTVELQVDSLTVNKDNVIAIYNSGCQASLF